MNPHLYFDGILLMLLLRSVYQYLQYVMQKEVASFR